MAGFDSLISNGLDQLSEGFGIFDKSLKLISCNRPFQKLRNYPDALCKPGTPLESMIRFNAERGDFGPGKIEDQVAERMAEIGQEDHRELEREMADGQILKIRYQHLEAGGLTVTFEDKTDERAAQQGLQSSEERYVLLSEAAEEGVYEWHIATGKFFASPRLEGILGIETDKAGTRDWRWDDRIHPEDVGRYRDSLAAHLSGEVSRWDCEYRFRNKAGDYRWLSDHGTSVRDEDGTAVRMVAAVSDVTDRVERDAALAASEERHTLVTQATSDGLYDWNVLEDRLFVSDRLNQLTAFDSGELSSKIWASRVHEDDIKNYTGAIRAHFQGETDHLECEYRIAGKTGEFRWVRDHGIGVRGEDGRVKRLVGAVRDITEIKAADEALAAASDRFQDAIESLSSGLALFDAEDRVVVCNSKYREYFPDLSDMVKPGTHFRNIIKTAIERGLFPLALDNPEEFLASVLKTRAAASGFREQHMRGGLWLQISDHRTTDGGIVSIYTDITDLKTREAELSTQSAILEATLENMEQGISMVDPELHVVMFNKKFLDYMQFPADRFKRGFHMSEAFRFNAERGEYGKGDHDKMIQERLGLSAKFQPHRFERTRADGAVLEIVGNPVESGGFVTTYTDITERKKAEQVLRDREAELSAVLDTIEYGVLFMGPDLRARVINRAFGKIWGISQDFIDGSPTMQDLIEYNRDTGLYNVPPEDWDSFVQDRVEAVRQGNVAPMELRRADGTALQYQCLVLPDGGRMLTYFDITDLKEREAELTTAKDAAEEALQDLRKAQARLVQAEKMASLGQLTAGIAHEIKNPLNFVNNFAKLSAELLEEMAGLLKEPIAGLPEEERDDAEDLFDTVKQNLQKINQHGRRADQIVKNMLLHSRDGPSQHQTVDLNALAEEALNLAYHGARAENSDFNVEMIKTLAPEVGDIECYPQDLMRVFLNLISNGMYAANKRKASDSAAGGPIEPAITVMTRDLGDKVAIEVRDNGSGIPAEIREQIFTPFFTTKPAGEGTGLGLSLSYDIVVKQHGGTLSVDSEPGEFTSFVVTVPRALPEEAMQGETAS